MTLQLSGRDERVAEPYAPPFEGRVIDTMPRLVTGYEKGKQVDVTRTPASFAYIVERRETAPKDVREGWQNYFFTGDAVIRGTRGDVLSVWDCALLRELTPESTLRDGALVLTQSQWNELKAQKEGVMYLSADEVSKAHAKGYALKEGKFAPVNATVGKIWDHLSRGKDLTNYAQAVSEASQSKDIMRTYFDQSTMTSPSGRLWVASSIDYDFGADGLNRLNNDYGRLVGVAPEAHVARKNALEARVQGALETGQGFEFNGMLYVPVDPQKLPR